MSEEILYGQHDQERLSCFSPEDALLEMLEEIETFMPEDYPGGVLDYADWPLEVVEYRRMRPSLSGYDVLDRFIEILAEEYGDPEGYETLPSEKMKEAEALFIRDVMEEYEVWACEPTGIVIVYTREYAEQILKRKGET